MGEFDTFEFWLAVLIAEIGATAAVGLIVFDTLVAGVVFGIGTAETEGADAVEAAVAYTGKLK